MNPIDVFHNSGELLMALSRLIIEATGYSGSPEGVFGMILMAAALLSVLS